MPAGRSFTGWAHGRWRFATTILCSISFSACATKPIASRLARTGSTAPGRLPQPRWMKSRESAPCASARFCSILAARRPLAERIWRTSRRLMAFQAAWPRPYSLSSADRQPPPVGAGPVRESGRAPVEPGGRRDLPDRSGLSRPAFALATPVMRPGIWSCPGSGSQSPLSLMVMPGTRSRELSVHLRDCTARIRALRCYGLARHLCAYQKHENTAKTGWAAARAALMPVLTLGTLRPHVVPFWRRCGPSGSSMPQDRPRSVPDAGSGSPGQYPPCARIQRDRRKRLRRGVPYLP